MPDSRLDAQKKYAHYYRFQEIVRDETFNHHPLPFERADVYPVINQGEHKASYRPDTAEYQLNNTFNYTYTGLLKTLHQTFNDNPQALRPAIGLMESLKEQALTMMSSITLPSGETAGPTFEYNPVNQ
jgi:hypothetical protein